MQHVQTKREISDRLAAAGIRPRKRFGQHFLIDGNLMRRLCETAELTDDDRVLEVGGGTGGLTDLLAAGAGRVVCVEIDQRLAQILKTRFADRPHVRVLPCDVLNGKHRLSEAVVGALCDPWGSDEFKLVANLPYQVATPLIMILLLEYPQASRLVLTVQREVADRLRASPGNREFGPVSILVQLLCRVKTVATLPPSVFWPQPSVDSVMLRLDVHASPFSDSSTLGGFTDFVRTTFEHRRKTLRSAFRYVLDEDRRDAVCASLDASRRPESFSIQEWLDMYRLVRAVS